MADTAEADGRWVNRLHGCFESAISEVSGLRKAATGKGVTIVEVCLAAQRALVDSIKQRAPEHRSQELERVITQMRKDLGDGNATQAERH